MLSNIKYKISAFLLCCSLLTITGCSKEPWLSTTIPEIEQQQYDILLEEVIELNKGCENKFDAEATFSLQSTLQKKTISGYLAAITPYKAKFIVTTPLGQPIYIVTVNDREFQAINVMDSSYQTGALGKVIKRLDLPQILDKLDVGMILEGNINQNFSNNEVPRLDKQARGIWFSDSNSEKGEHILIDPQQKLIVERIIDEPQGDSIVIQYKQQTEVDDCLKPTSILVSGLSYGAEIHIELKDILGQPLFTGRDFLVKIPTGFNNVPLQ